MSTTISVLNLISEDNVEQIHVHQKMVLYVLISHSDESWWKKPQLYLYFNSQDRVA